MKKRKNAIIASETSIESFMKSEELAGRLGGRILDLARRARGEGLTINEAERQIEDHKGHSISPRFSQLVRTGALVRVFIGYGQPTRSSPQGVRRYVTRHDEETGRHVVVHWLAEFAPVRKGNESDGAPTAAPIESTHCEGEYND